MNIINFFALFLYANLIYLPLSLISLFFSSFQFLIYYVVRYPNNPTIKGKYSIWKYLLTLISLRIFSLCIITIIFMIFNPSNETLDFIRSGIALYFILLFILCLAIQFFIHKSNTLKSLGNKMYHITISALLIFESLIMSFVSLDLSLVAGRSV